MIEPYDADLVVEFVMTGFLVSLSFYVVPLTIFFIIQGSKKITHS